MTTDRWTIASVIPAFGAAGDSRGLGTYRAIRLPVPLSLARQEMTYGWPAGMTVKAARRNVRIIEPPVSTHLCRSGRSRISGAVRRATLAVRSIPGETVRYAFICFRT